MNVDVKLIQGLNLMLEGKEEGFNIVYSHTYDYVYKRARFFMKNEQDALDLVQETFIQAYKGIKSLDNVNNIYAWLSGIAFRQGTKILRKRKDILVDEEGEGIFEEIVSEDMDSNPEQTAESKATSDVVKGIIEDLPDVQKAAVMAFYYDRMKIDDIAELFQCSPNTIKSRLNYAKKYIREQIEAHEKKYEYRLHSLSPIIIVWAIQGLFEEEAYVATSSAIESTYRAACGQLGLQVARIVAVDRTNSAQTMADEAADKMGLDLVGSTVKKAGLKLGTKIAIGVTAVTILGGVIVAIIHANRPTIVPPVLYYFGYGEDDSLQEPQEDIEHNVVEQILGETGLNLIQEEEPEWVQAYKDFLLNKENLYPIVIDVYETDLNDRIVRGGLNGFVLHDMNQDSVPELLFCRTEAECNIYIYSYVDGEVCFVDRSGYDAYDQTIAGETWGVDKETGETYAYQEGVYEEICFSLYHINLNGREVERENVWYGGCVDENSEAYYEMNNPVYWENNRKFLWDKCYQNNFASDNEEFHKLNNFIPFKWRGFSTDEIENYVNVDYEESNLAVESQAAYYLRVEDVDYKKTSLINREVDNLLCYPLEVADDWQGEECIEYMYIDTEQLYYFSDLEQMSIEDINGTEEEMYMVTAPDGYVNFRYGPGTEYGIIKPISNNEKLLISCKDATGRWAGVWYQEQFGWVALSQVTSLAE